MSKLLRSDRAKILLSLIYAAGVIGTILLPEGIRDVFLAMTPLTLISTAYFLIKPHTSKNIWTYAGICMSVGLIIEMIGVNTGAIFGEYAYGSVLGPKIWNTPIVIGVNWFVLAASAYAFVSIIFRSVWWRAVTGAAVMTALDYLIEPVAIKLGFWHWYGKDVPMQNYISWYATASLLMYVAYRLNISFSHNLPLHVLKLQFLFFACLLLLA